VEMMSPLDASFLHVEDAVTHMHIGSVGIFEAPAPGPGEVQSAVAARLPQVPRYRQKVRFVPLALGRPAWWTIHISTSPTACGARHFRRPAATRNCAASERQRPDFHCNFAAQSPSPHAPCQRFAAPSRNANA
jgi:hypothetical protein